MSLWRRGLLGHGRLQLCDVGRFDALCLDALEEILPTWRGGTVAEAAAGEGAHAAVPRIGWHAVERIVVAIDAERGGHHLVLRGLVGRHKRTLRIEVKLRGERHGAQRLPHRGVEETENQLLVLQLHFDLGGAHIDVDGRRVDVDGDEIGGPVPLRDQLGIGGLHGIIEQVVPHIAVVDEHVLLAFFLLGVLGLGNVSGNLHEVGFLLHGE